MLPRCCLLCDRSVVLFHVAARTVQKSRRAEMCHVLGAVVRLTSVVTEADAAETCLLSLLCLIKLQCLGAYFRGLLAIA